MKRIIIWLAVATFVMAPSINAQSKAMNTTDGLASACRLYASLTDKTPGTSDSDKYMQAGFCMGYMAGFAHAASLASAPDLCMPESINLSEVVKAFLKYVDAHPEELQLSAKVTVPHALKMAFPCKTRQ